MNRIARLAPAAVLTAAVVVSASAGGAVAAKMVTGKDIKNGTVTTADVKNDSLTGKDVRTGSLQESDLGAGVKQKLNEPSVVGYQVVTATTSIPTASRGTTIAFCPAGKVALSGGAQWEDGALETGATLQDSFPGKAIGEFFAPLEPGDVATAWQARGEHNNLDAVDLTVHVVCVDPA